MGTPFYLDWNSVKKADQCVQDVLYLVMLKADDKQLRVLRAGREFFLGKQNHRKPKQGKPHGLFAYIAKRCGCAQSTARKRWNKLVAWICTEFGKDPSFVEGRRF